MFIFFNLLDANQFLLKAVVVIARVRFFMILIRLLQLLWSFLSIYFGIIILLIILFKRLYRVLGVLFLVLQ